MVPVFKLFHYWQPFFEKEADLNIVVIDISSNVINKKITELINSKSQILGMNYPSGRNRIKSYFSFKKKSMKFEDCYDLFGLEFLFDEVDFFSKKLRILHF